LDHIEQTVAVKQQYVCDQSLYRVSWNSRICRLNVLTVFLMQLSILHGHGLDLSVLSSSVLLGIICKSA